MRRPRTLTLTMLVVALVVESFGAGSDPQPQSQATQRQTLPASHIDRGATPQQGQISNAGTEGQTPIDDVTRQLPLGDERQVNRDESPAQPNSDLSQELQSQSQLPETTEEQNRSPLITDIAQEEYGPDASEGNTSALTQETQTTAPTVQNLPQMQAGPLTVEQGHSVSEAESEQRSYVTAGFTLSGAAQVTPPYGSSSFQTYTTTRLFGIFDLAKTVHRFDTSVQYRGGGYFFKDTGAPWSDRQVHQLTVSEKIRWERTRLLVQDSISDFPGASFGSSAFGGSSAYNLGLGGNTGIGDFFGLTTFGGFGTAQHFTNVVLADLNQELTPRSSLTFAAAHAITDYFGAQSINTQQLSGIAGYTYLLSPKSQLSISVGYQRWRFTGYDTSNAYSAQAGYTRQLSPRIAFSLGAGPQLITSHTPTIIAIGPIQLPVIVDSRQTGVTGEGSLAYNWSRGSAALSYEHLVTDGSGLFAGANSDIATFNISRPTLRSWTTDFSTGFAHLSSLGNGSAGILQNASQYWFASAGVARRLGRHLNLSASYQFSSQTTVAGCNIATSCGSMLHTAQLSLSWRTLPFSLDRGRDRDRPSVSTNSVPVSEQKP